MPQTTKQYEVKTVRELIKLWTDNPHFNKLVGPTYGHLKIWMSKQNFNYTSNSSSNKKGIFYSNTEEIECFLVGNSYDKYIMEYIDYKYSKEGIKFIEQYVNGTETDIVVRPAAMVKYIIDNNIRMDGISATVKLCTPDIDTVVKLFALGLNDNNNYYSARFNHWVNYDKLITASFF